MIRIWFVVFAPLLVGCADQSEGSALNACRMRYYLDLSATQQQSVSNCMQERSFRLVSDCSPQSDIANWDRAAGETAYLNPQCYRPVGAAPWTATQLSPM